MVVRSGGGNGLAVGAEGKPVKGLPWRVVRLSTVKQFLPKGLATACIPDNDALIPSCRDKTFSFGIEGDIHHPLCMAQKRVANPLACFRVPQHNGMVVRGGRHRTAVALGGGDGPALGSHSPARDRDRR